MTTTILKWIIRMLPLGYIGVIWLQSSLFNPEVVENSPKLGLILELGHLFMFGFLYILMILAFMTYGKLTVKKELTVLCLVFLFALGDEIHQYYVPYRSASLDDMFKNSIGIIAAWYLVRIIRKFIGLRKIKLF